MKPIFRRYIVAVALPAISISLISVTFLQSEQKSLLKPSATNSETHRHPGAVESRPTHYQETIKTRPTANSTLPNEVAHLGPVTQTHRSELPVKQTWAALLRRLKSHENVLNSGVWPGFQRDLSGSSARDIDRRMSHLVRDIELERQYKNSRLKLEIMKHGRNASQENRLLEKVFGEADSDRPEGQTEKDCVIEIMKFCFDYCETVPKNYLSNEFNNCSFSGCRVRVSIGVNMTVFMRSDVVIFLPGIYDWAYLSIMRPRGQLWVFHSKESPEHWPDFTPPPELGNPFNLSITYMSDSDIAHPYYYYQPNASAENLPPIQPKSQLISWMASNCNETAWNRMGLVRTLQDYIPIDTYGECGSNPSSACAFRDPSCRSRFKFNLALENSQCSEYTTEKFWFSSLQLGTVPVVFGAPKEDYARLAPPHSFIHLDDFESPEDLAIFLKELDNNATRYLEYFAWRKTGTVRRSSTLLAYRKFERHTICYIVGLLIEKSFDPTKFPWLQRHPVFHDWWTGLCTKQKQIVLGLNISYTGQSVGIPL